MANPGYPMQQPPMPATPMPQPKPAKRGTSKMVPVVVSAGLAVGTFCGLLFGLGTGEPASAASSSDTKKDDAKPDDPKKDAPPPQKAATTEPAKTETPKPAEPAAAAGSGSAAPATAAAGSGSAATATAAAGSGSAAPAAAGAGSGSAAPAVAGAGSGSAATAAAAKPAVDAPKKAKLTIEIAPDTAVQGAKITVDGKAVDGTAADIDLGKDGKKKVKVVIKANGFKTYEKDYEIDGDVKVSAELVKRPASTGPATPPSGGTKPGNGGKKKPPGGGGLIDI